MNKNGFINIIIIGVVVIIIAVAGYFAVTRKPAEAPAITQETETVKESAELIKDDLTTKDWKTYRNEKRSFEFKYPDTWNISIMKLESNDFDDTFMVFPTREAPDFFEGSGTQVTIASKGIGSEGPFSQRQLISKKLTQVEEGKMANLFILKDQTPWGVFVGFENQPPKWRDGFVWGSVEVKNKKLECLRQGKIIPMKECEIFESNDEVQMTGTIDSQAWDTILKILSTFKFIE